MTMRAALSCTLALLIISSGSLVLFNPAAAEPDGIDDGATFTVQTGGIYPHLSAGGQICAEKTSSGANKVTVTNSTLKNVDIYVGKEGGVESHISFPSGEVNGALILYTNGENPLVNTLALLGVCLPPGTPNPIPTTLEAYWLGVSNLQPNNITVTSGGDPPEASGPSLQQVLDTTNTSTKEIGVNNSSELSDRVLQNSSGEWISSDNTAPIVNNTTETNTTATNNTATPTDGVTNTTATSTPVANGTQASQTTASNDRTDSTTITTTTTTSETTKSAGTQTASGQTPNRSTTESIADGANSQINETNTTAKSS